MKSRFTTSEGAPATRAVRRAARLLATLGAARGSLPLGALARAASLSKPTTFRLLAALELEEFVVRDAGETYALGPALVGLGAQARRAIRLNDAARPVLTALAEETGETATLEVLVGTEVLILDEVQGRFLLGAMPEIGMCWPASVTSTGRVLLAATDATSPVTLAGFATTFEELEPGFAAVAAPVRNADGVVIAAISVGGPSVRLTRERLAALAPRVRGAAERVSQRLGAPPLPSLSTTPA